MHYLIRNTKEICSPRQDEVVIDGEQAATKSCQKNSNDMPPDMKSTVKVYVVWNTLPK